MCDARYAEVKMRVEKYGRDGRADGAALVASGLRVIWLILDDSSGTMR